MNETFRSVFSDGINDDVVVSIAILDRFAHFALSASRYSSGDEVEVTVPPDQFLIHAEALKFISDKLGEYVPGRKSPFVREWDKISSDVFRTAVDNGFWPDDPEARNIGELLALIHSEVSEALEAMRDGNPPDSKLPAFDSVETELADVVIRIMDLAAARGWRVAEAIEAKAEYNKTRDYKHGRSF